jgi:hypothetical protein
MTSLRGSARCSIENGSKFMVCCQVSWRAATLACLDQGQAMISPLFSSLIAQQRLTRQQSASWKVTVNGVRDCALAYATLLHSDLLLQLQLAKARGVTALPFTTSVCSNSSGSSSWRQQVHSITSKTGRLAAAPAVGGGHKGVAHVLGACRCITASLTRNMRSERLKGPAGGRPSHCTLPDSLAAGTGPCLPRCPTGTAA